MTKLVITLDLDWACEPAIEETLDYLHSLKITPTVFATHRSPSVESQIDKIEVGLHPYFDANSSQGATIEEVVNNVMQLPHNLPAFRCHRFALSNASKQAMYEAGMRISSNVCTDLETLPSFKDRFGFTEVPIFLEDGGYLWRKHPLQMTENFRTKLFAEGIKVLLIHPMHFAINTPEFSYMAKIKSSMTREEWINMTKKTLDTYRWKGRGIRDFLKELLQLPLETAALGAQFLPHVKSHSLP
ncbi:MAG: hypothetical protein KR126chlam1_00140 [Chlamydiae bacterium]|nr:hypothetical protein [Chlamydiota bacterium]